MHKTRTGLPRRHLKTAGGLEVVRWCFLISPHVMFCFYNSPTVQLSHICVSVQELKFTLAVTKMKGYFEAFFEERPPFKLSLVEINTEETVWSATIREGAGLTLKAHLVFKKTPILQFDGHYLFALLLGDCVNTEKKPRKRTNSMLLFYFFVKPFDFSSHIFTF